MDVNLMQIFTVGFKVIAIITAIFYVLYSLIISKQVGIMDKTLEDGFNKVIITICSLQTTIALVILILVIFFA